MKWINIAAILAAIISIAFYVAYPSATYRYRITVAVDTPSGQLLGSGVAEVTHEKRIPWMTNSDSILAATARGEAFYIDFGPAGKMFILLRGAHRCSLLEDRVPYLFGIRRIQHDKDYINKLREVQGERPIPSECFPLFVRFGNPLEPATIEIVDPGALDITFGPGFRVAQITLKIVSDRLATGLLFGTLPWLRHPPRQILSFKHSNGRPDLIYATDFIRSQ